MDTTTYQPKHKLRLVTAAALFDGHDAAINIMRRIMQRSGAEIIHLGHNRSAQEIVDTAIQEDVQGIAITSYQGGHNEYFKYIFDLLKARGAGHIRIFGGGGGTILPEEIQDLHDYGIARIYSPDDGRAMGLQGMINDLLRQCDFETGTNIAEELEQYKAQNKYAVARLISAAENNPEASNIWLSTIYEEAKTKNIPVLGQLFRKNSNSGDRTELIVLITPYLISNGREAKDVTDAFRGQLGEWARDSTLGAAAQRSTKPEKTSPVPAISEPK